MSKKNENFKTSIGGQALIEGIMMKGPKKTSIAVRKPDGEIVLKTENTEKLNNGFYFKIPIIRGFARLVEAIYSGTAALTYSASFFEEEEYKKQRSKIREFLDSVISILISFVVTMGIFIFLPTFIANFLKTRISSNFALNIIEGIIRIIIFLLYMFIISKIDSINRVFQYHGAEHQAIHCYENKLDLTVDNVQKFNPEHPRCGTSFLFMVMAVSIIVLSFFGWPNPYIRILIRILMLPIIAGISYEINKFLGRKNSKFNLIFTYPGLLLQKAITTKKPSDDMVEVAIVALKAVIPEENGEDSW